MEWRKSENSDKKKPEAVQFDYICETVYVRKDFENHKEELYRQQIAPFVGECFDLVKIKEIYSILICDGLKLKSTDNLQKYVDNSSLTKYKHTVQH